MAKTVMKLLLVEKIERGSRIERKRDAECFAYMLTGMNQRGRVEPDPDTGRHFVVVSGGDTELYMRIETMADL